MLVPCEVAVKCALPAIRAMIAKEFVNKHGMKQSEAAKLLGVSQPAISLYSRKMRGKAIDLESDAEITKLIENLAASLTKEPLTHTEFIPLFCEICRTIRRKKLLCAMHKTLDPSINPDKCELCSTPTRLSCP